MHVITKELAAPFPWKNPSTRSLEPYKIQDDMIEFTNEYNAGPSTSLSVAETNITGAGWEEAAIPPEVLEDPEVMAVFRGVDDHTNISWRLPVKLRTSGGVLSHATKTMAVLQAKLSPFIFKFGFTHDPCRRWEHGVYGYRWEKDRWEHMLVLYLSAEAAGPAMLEAALIDKYRRRSVCVY